MGLGDAAARERSRRAAGTGKPAARTYTNADLGHTRKWRELTDKDPVYDESDEGARYYAGSKGGSKTFTGADLDELDSFEDVVPKVPTAHNRRARRKTAGDDGARAWRRRSAKEAGDALASDD